ncbi:MAG: hypothetical protein ACOCZK_06555 [Planctomycetota bacterium]
MKWLREHWEIKLIALVLSVTLYFFIGGVTTLEQAFPVAAQRGDVRGLPRDFVITDITPEEFIVRLRGPRSLIEDIEVEALRPNLVFERDELARGQQVFPVTGRLLGLPPELQVVEHEQDVIRVHVSRLVTSDLVVKSSDVRLDTSGLPRGVTVKQHFFPGEVRVRLRGVAAQIEALQQREQPLLEPVDLADLVEADLAREVAKTLELHLAVGPGVEIVGNPDLEIQVTFAPVVASRNASQEVVVLAPEDYLAKFAVTVMPQPRAYRISGPRNLLEAIDLDEEVTLYVDLRSRPAVGEGQDYPVRHLAPSWADIDVGTVQVAIAPRATPDP